VRARRDARDDAHPLTIATVGAVCANAAIASG
jgi:hypothetical protein